MAAKETQALDFSAIRSCTRLLACAGLALALIGCQGELSERGYVLDPDDFEDVTPGVDTRQDVIDIMGTPSTFSAFQDDKWYYISETTEQMAFFRPSVLDRSVIIITFDESGLVAEKNMLFLEDGQEIDLVSRETPTEGREISLLQELFGNLGRFTGDGTSRAPSSAPGGIPGP